MCFFSVPIWRDHPEILHGYHGDSQSELCKYSCLLLPALSSYCLLLLTDQRIIHSFFPDPSLPFFYTLHVLIWKALWSLHSILVTKGNNSEGFGKAASFWLSHSLLSCILSTGQATYLPNIGCKMGLSPHSVQISMKSRNISLTFLCLLWKTWP